MCACLCAAGLAKLGLKPRAKIVSLALAGSDPIMMLAGPIPATRTALKKAKLTMDDMECYEVNEAFSSIPLAWAKVGFVVPSCALLTWSWPTKGFWQCDCTVLEFMRCLVSCDKVSPVPGVLEVISKGSS